MTLQQEGLEMLVKLLHGTVPLPKIVMLKMNPVWKQAGISGK